MKIFLLGIIGGVLIGLAVSAFTSFAQLVPLDAPLAQQLQGQRAENWLRLNRDVEAMERGVDRDPLVPCR